MAPLRWIFAGSFTAKPNGAITVVSGSRLADVMAKLSPVAKVEIEDRLGSARTRSFELQFGRPRALRVQDVVADQSPLKELAEIATALSRPRDAMSIDDAVKRIVAIVGDGALARAVAATTATTTSTAPAPTPAPSAAASPAAPSGGDIFDKVGLPNEADTVSVAKSGVDAFIGAIRGKPAGKGAATDRTPGLRAAEIVLDAIEATAADALASPQAAAIESAWRGIKMVLSLSPGHGELAISVMDVGDGQLVDGIGRVLAEPHELRPDAVFVLPAIADPRRLRELATLAESATVPVVTAIDPSLLDDGREGVNEAAPLERWNALRSEPACAWLAGTTNEIVLANEETRVGPRVVFGSPVLGLAAILTAAFSRGRGFADAIGRAGAVASPASHVVEGGASIPTRAALAPDALRALASHGLVALGHEREGERMLVVDAPMIERGGGPSLPARILVGRTVRTAIAARDTLPRGASNREIETAFAKAGAAFLPDSPGACTLHAHAHGDHLHVQARLAASLLGRVLEFDFSV